MSNISYEHVFAADYAPVHNFGMDVNIPDLLKAMIPALPTKRKTQEELAAALHQKGKRGVKVSQPQVSRWISGRQEPERQAYERILAVASDLGVLSDVRSEDVAASLATPPRPPKVRIKGYIGAAGEGAYYRYADEMFETTEAPADATDQTVALEIKGTSWGPLVVNWLVFYDDIRSPITADLIGKTCVVGTADDRILLKEIRRNRRGGFDLYSNSDEPPIENAEIEWAAAVTGMRPR